MAFFLTGSQYATEDVGDDSSSGYATDNWANRMIHFIVIAANHGRPVEPSSAGESAVVALLEDMLLNSIFVDTQGLELSNNLYHCIDGFSKGFAQKAKLLLDSLVSKQRVLKVPVAAPSNGDGHSWPDCQAYQRLSHLPVASHLLLGSGCVECEANGRRRASTTTIPNYLLSTALEQLRSSHQIQFLEGQDADILQNTIIQPMISVAGSLSFYDSLVGTKLDPKLHPTPARNYLHGVEALLTMVDKARVRASRSRVGVRIVTTLPNPRDFRYTSVQLRRAWSSELGLPKSFPELDIEFCYKQAARAIFHQRYLANSKFAISIDRGLDIVNNDGTLRQCQLDILNERKVIRDIDESEDA